VAERLGDIILVKLDFTGRSAANDELRRSLAIIGMPTVIFFDPGGRELDRFSGFVDGERFVAMLDGLK
jgi:thiol:disulfide interchange protein DsbD